MTKLQELQAEIQALPSNELIELSDWIAELKSDVWDEKIRQDSISGKLDFLKEQALAAKKNGTLRDL